HSGMTDSKRSRNSDLLSKLRGIKPAAIEKQFYASTEFIEGQRRWIRHALDGKSYSIVKSAWSAHLIHFVRHDCGPHREEQIWSPTKPLRARQARFRTTMLPSI